MTHPLIPVLRIFDGQKAREFYVEFLEWKIDWTHRFEENFPEYLQISQGDKVLHLTEHHGDACPGATVRIAVQGIDAVAESLRARNYKYAKPDVEAMPWNTKEMRIRDPFGNSLIFWEPSISE